MKESIDIFLGEIKCKLQLFHPKPGDVFVLTIPVDLSFEEEKHLRAGFAERLPDIKMAVVIGPTSIDLQKGN